jgi:hypothetical protein
MKAYREWRYSSTILDVGAWWKWLVSFTPRKRATRYPLDRYLDVSQSRFGRYGENKNFAAARNQTLATQHVTLQTDYTYRPYFSARGLKQLFVLFRMATYKNMDDTLNLEVNMCNQRRNETS